MAKQAGYNLRVKVNGTFYRTKRAEFDDTVTDLEVGDSEDGVFEAHMPGRSVARITLENATYDPALNPFAPPFSLQAGQYADVQIYFAGIGEDPEDIPSMMVTSAKKTGDVAALSPVTITGISNGTYIPAST